MKSSLSYLKYKKRKKIRTIYTIRAIPSRLNTGRSLYFNSRTYLNFQDIKSTQPMPFFTPEDLVLYLYKETSPQQTLAIEEAKQTDWALREKLNVIEASIQKLENIKVSPRTEIILDILNYAKMNTAKEVL